MKRLLLVLMLLTGEAQAQPEILTAFHPQLVAMVTYRVNGNVHAYYATRRRLIEMGVGAVVIVADMAIEAAMTTLNVLEVENTRDLNSLHHAVRLTQSYYDNLMAYLLSRFY